jgi:hypothetical protein
MLILFFLLIYLDLYNILSLNRYLANFYIAEALLYADKINESIDCLTFNSKIETDDDIAFTAPSIIEKTIDEGLNIQEIMNSSNKSIFS